MDNAALELSQAESCPTAARQAHPGDKPQSWVWHHNLACGARHWLSGAHEWAREHVAFSFSEVRHTAHSWLHPARHEWYQIQRVLPQGDGLPSQASVKLEWIWCFHVRMISKQLLSILNYGPSLAVGPSNRLWSFGPRSYWNARFDHCNADYPVRYEFSESPINGTARRRS